MIIRLTTASVQPKRHPLRIASAGVVRKTWRPFVDEILAHRFTYSVLFLGATLKRGGKHCFKLTNRIDHAARHSLSVPVA